MLLLSAACMGQRKLPVTVYAVGMALERNPEAAKAMVNAGWEVSTHDSMSGMRVYAHSFS